nr:hypothetical protein [Tanacetum cinerariifolium]
QAVRECTYPDFLKCQPLKFKGTEGVIELTHWFEKIESVFNISNCTSACQVKYAACTLQGVALTWWNSHVKTVTMEVAQELALMCDRTFPEESDRVEKYISGVPNTIHDSVKAAKPKTMHEEIEFATELMDKRIRDAIENKRKFEGNSDRNMYTGPKPLCSKYEYHHKGPCLPGAIIAKGLAIWPGTVEVDLQMPTTTTTATITTTTTATKTTIIKRETVALSAELKDTLKETALN